MSIENKIAVSGEIYEEAKFITNMPLSATDTFRRNAKFTCWFLDPKPTEKYTVEELKKLRIRGVYRRVRHAYNTYAYFDKATGIYSCHESVYSVRDYDQCSM